MSGLAQSSTVLSATERALVSSSGITYDAGALIAAERGDVRVGGIHADALRRGVSPTVPAGVLAQVWRGNVDVAAALERALRNHEAVAGGVGFEAPDVQVHLLGQPDT